MSQSLLQTYVEFLRSPDLIAPPPNLSARQIRHQILQLYSLHLLIVIGLGVLITLFVDQQDHALQELIGNLSWRAVIAIAVVLPLIEELIFRLPLRGTPFNLALSTSLLVLASLALLPNLKSAYGLGIGAMLIGLNLYLLLARPRIAAIERVYRQHARLIFYGLVLLFGALHVTNYDIKVWPLLPLLVSPQIILGLWFGFIRLRYGFGWAVLTHGLHNALLTVPILLVNPEAEPETLTNTLLAGLIGLLWLVGITACCANAWGLIRDWRRS